MKIFFIFICLLSALGFSSCSDDGGDQARPTEAPKRKSFSERLSEKNGYSQDAEGNWKAKSNKRSQFESKGDSNISKGKVAKKDYKNSAGEYGKSSWWGGKDYKKSEYAGNTDGSRFRKEASQGGQKARVNGQSAKVEGDFKTNSIERESARQSGFPALDRPASASVNAARDSYKAPSVIDWKEQRGLSLGESRGILGR